MQPVLLIGDFTLDLVYEAGVFVPSAGGSVFNVASVLRKNKVEVSFISRVGNDLTGKILLNQIEQLGISKNTIIQDENFRTSVAFSEYDSDGKPHYSFYKDKKTFLFSDEKLLNEKYSLFHIGSSFAFSENSFSTVMKICKLMTKNRIPISYDINLRKNPTESEKVRIFALMEKVEIIKGSDEDFYFLYGTDEKMFVMDKILSDFNNKIGIVTYGKNGAFLFSRSDSCFVKQDKILENIKSIGAGDSFMAGVILYYLKNSCLQDLKELGNFANKTAIDFLSERKNQ